MALNTNLIDSWFFENNLDNNILGRDSLIELSSYPQGMLFSAFDLFIQAENSPSGGGQQKTGMNLYIQNTDPKNPIPSSIMNLFINNFYDIANKNLPMKIIGGSTSLGSSPTRSAGYIPATGVMNMFINNNDPAQLTTNTTLFVSGPITQASGQSLFISGGFDNTNGQITFWTSGIAQHQQGTNLFIAGY